MLKTYKYLLVVFFTAVFFLPAIQKAFRIVPMQKFALVKVPDNFTSPVPAFKTFLENTYQDSVVKWFNATTGFKPLLVRLRNQMDYSCFHLAHGKVIYGKSGYLFLDESTESFVGQTFDSALLCRRMDTVDMLRNYLAQASIPLLFVIAPGRGAFYQAYLPDEYKAMKKPVTQYELLLDKLKSRHADYIDLAAYFNKIGSSSPYRLFPKQAMHWSTYGAAVGLDTLYKKIAATLKFEPVKIDLSDVTVSSERKFPEYDLSEMMNILKMPYADTLAYPEPVCKASDSGEVRKPKILFVGDSYTYIFGLTNLPTQLFDSASRYWFYMQQEKDFANIMKEGADLSNKDLQTALKPFDLVVILSTDARYDYGDYGLYSRLSQRKKQLP